LTNEHKALLNDWKDKAPKKQIQNKLYWSQKVILVSKELIKKSTNKIDKESYNELKMKCKSLLNKKD